jgi:hypothetical protein
MSCEGGACITTCDAHELMFEVHGAVGVGSAWWAMWCGCVANIQNQATGAHFQLTKSRGYPIQIGGAWFGRGTLGFGD